MSNKILVWMSLSSTLSVLFFSIQRYLFAYTSRSMRARFSRDDLLRPSRTFLTHNFIIRFSEAVVAPPRGRLTVHNMSIEPRIRVIRSVFLTPLYKRFALFTSHTQRDIYVYNGQSIIDEDQKLK